MSSPTPLTAMFDRASDRYDALNSILSLGQDGPWRDRLAEALEPGLRVLDVCCGSGRSSVADFKRCRTAVIGIDASAAMLTRGKHHAARHDTPFRAVRGDALHLPFRDHCFDAVTLAWGFRNLKPEEDALGELCRVLRPGGWMHILDSPTPEPGLTGHLHRLYLRHIVPLAGRFSADADAYGYLSESILAFGRASEVEERLRQAGLRVEPPLSLLLGAAAVWRAQKPAQGTKPGGHPAKPHRETVQSAPGLPAGDQ